MKSNQHMLVMAVTAAILLTASLSMAQPGMMPGMYGYGIPPGYHYYGGIYRPEGNVIDRDKADKIVESYVRSLENPNLKHGPVTDKGNLFEAEILTQDGAMVDRIWIVKETGRVTTQYGMPYGGMGQGRGMGERWNFCPYCGNDMNMGRYPLMGPGMPGYGGGMMHHGRRYNGNFRDRRPDSPVEKEDVRKMVENYLTSVGNPNLEIGDIKQTDDGFEVEIVTKKMKDLVNRLVIDKDTGRMGSAYGM